MEALEVTSSGLLEFEVFGEPAPQGSKTIYRGRLVESSAKKLNPWRKAIAAVVEEALPDTHSPILGPVRVEIDLFVTRPPSIKRSKREFPIVPPDIDKICRGILDGLNQGPDGKANNGRLWGDDSQVVELVARKFYADDRAPGADIRIFPL